jgi:hypothetical protein
MNSIVSIKQCLLLIPAVLFSVLVLGQGFYMESMHTKKNTTQLPVTSDSIILENYDDDAFINSFYEEHGWRSGRIVGGNDANIEDYPWIVALLSSGGSQYCAGTILSETWILTAAHCSTPNRIRAGVTDKTDNTGQDRFIISKINHPLYSPYQNDIALIQLSSPLDLSDPKVTAIPIVTAAHASDGYTDAGVISVVTGWGRLSQGGASTNILQVVELPLVSNEDAVSIGWYGPTQITIDMLCAGLLGEGGIDACQGDSGGPLVVPDTGSPLGYSVAGVTSWGTGCAQPQHPGVWARVSHFESWIASHTGLSWNSPVTTPNVSDFEAMSSGPEIISLSWTNNVNDDDILLVWSDTPMIGHPFDGVSYNIGDAIPGGGTVLYNGNINAFDHAGLDEGATYYYRIWSFDPGYQYSIGRFGSATTGCSVFTLPFTETFEDDSGYFNCWDQIEEAGPKLWSNATGAAGGVITGARSGDKNARFSSTRFGPYVTKFVSPILDLNNYEDVKLSFWYGQEAWGSDQNELRLYYRTGLYEPWIQIGDAFTGNISSWTQAEDIVLPNPSSSYQIAFEGTDNWGRATVLDDIEITGTWVGPPAELSLQNILLGNGDDECFAATDHIFIAGGGTTFIVEDGAVASVTSGESIHFFDGTKIEAGSSLHAYIDTSGDYCSNHESILAENQGHEKRIDSDHQPTEPDEVVHPDQTLTNIYPNPSRGIITLELSGYAQSELSVYDMSGLRLVDKTLLGSDKYELDLSFLPGGIYLLRVQNIQDISIHKLIIQKH